MITLMTRYDALRTYLIDLLVSLNATPEVPISLYDIGPPLVAKGFDQQQIVNVLFSLEGQKVVELVGGNRLRVTEKFYGNLDN